MAAMDVRPTVRSREEEAFVPRKKFKTSDLPLNSTQRAIIDGLLHTIKKKGEYDALRKKIWSEYAESVSLILQTMFRPTSVCAIGLLTPVSFQEDKKEFNSSLNELAESETDRDPSLLSRDRGKAATLMQGAVDRSDVYKSVELSLDKLIAAHIGHIQEAGREIRKAEAGEDIAFEEEKRGNKTDEEYAKESTARREAREETRKKEEARKRREDEMEKLRAEEKKKKLELEKLRSADERRREEEAKEARREKERVAQRAAAEQLEKEREAERRERYERRKREELERGRDSGRSRHQAESHSRERYRSSHRGSEPHRDLSPQAIKQEAQPSPDPSAAPPAVDEKALEAAALELLLREGRELAAKNTLTNPPTRSESLEPPISRKPHFSSRTPGTPTIEPHPGPKLTYSTTNLPATHSSRLPRSPHHSHSGHHRNSDRSPSHSHHHHRDHYRSRSRSTSRRHSARYDLSPDAKAAWKAKASAQRERDAEAYKRARSRSPTYERESREHHHYHESSRRYSISSHDRGERGDRGERREGERERSGRHESEKYDKEYRERSYTAHRRNRDKSPVEIDRYVPGGGSMTVTVAASHRDGRRERGDRDSHRERGDRDGHRERGDRDRERDRSERDREGGSYKDGERDRESRSYREGTEREGRHRESREAHREHRDAERESRGYRDGERESRSHRDGERESRGHREDEREGRGHRESGREGRGGYVEIDRYVPGREKR